MIGHRSLHFEADFDFDAKRLDEEHDVTRFDQHVKSNGTYLFYDHEDYKEAKLDDRTTNVTGKDQEE